MVRTREELFGEYKGRTCVVTGADGFVGSCLCDTLIEAGAEVFGFVRPTSSGSLHNVGHLDDHERFHTVLCNFEDLHSVTMAYNLIKDREGIIIFHLGAQAHVGESWDRPYETINSNVIGTLNLLQAAFDMGLDLHKFDTAGTSEEYGNVHEDKKDQYDWDESGGLLLHERSPINPKSIYATSKIAADFLTMNFFDAYDLPAVTTRMFNNYGPRQNPRYITGTIISQALKREVITLGNLSPKRDFCYVEDGAIGHMHVALWGNPGEVYVYGYGSNVTMQEWADMILKIGHDKGFWKDRRIETTTDRNRPGRSDVEELKVGYAKLNALTGWEPSVHHEEGLLRTIQWYAENEAKWIDRVDWK